MPSRHEFFRSLPDKVFFLKKTVFFISLELKSEKRSFCLLRSDQFNVQEHIVLYCTYVVIHFFSSALFTILQIHSMKIEVIALWELMLIKEIKRTTIAAHEFCFNKKNVFT